MTTIVTRTGKGSPLTHAELDTNFTNLNTNKLETAAIPLGTNAAPSISFLSDANTGIYSPGEDQLAAATNGVERVKFGTTATEVVFNDTGVNYDFRVEGDTVDSLFFVDASADRIGIGTSNPAYKLDVVVESNKGIGAFAPASSAGITDFSVGGVGWTFTRPNGVYTHSMYSYDTAAAAKNNFAIQSRNDIVFINGGGPTTSTETMRIVEGKVGIGSTGPSDKLSVAGSSATDFRSLTLRNASGTVGSAAVLTFEASTGTEGETGAIAAQIKGVRDGAGTAGGLEFWTSGSGTPLQRARLDSSGRLLVGTSTNTKNLRGEMSAAIVGVGSNTNAGLGITGYCGTPGPAYPLLDLQRSRGVTDGSMTPVASEDKLGSFSFRGADGTNFITAASIEGEVDGSTGANNMPGRLVFSTTSVSASSPTEAMRINKQRQVLIGTTSASLGCLSVVDNALCSVTQQALIYAKSSQSGDTTMPGLYISKFTNNTTTSQVLVKFANNNATQGQGQINANGASEAAFGSFSDRRLKENIVELPSQLENLCSLRPVEFDFKDGSGHQIGFIAQEMQAVYPDAVAEGDNEMLTITGWGKTQARIVKALQEAIAKIETLEQRLTAAGID